MKISRSSSFRFMAISLGTFFLLAKELITQRFRDKWLWDYWSLCVGSRHLEWLKSKFGRKDNKIREGKWLSRLQFRCEFGISMLITDVFRKYFWFFFTMVLDKRIIEVTVSYLRKYNAVICMLLIVFNYQLRSGRTHVSTSELFVEMISKLNIFNENYRIMCDTVTTNLE